MPKRISFLLPFYEILEQRLAFGNVDRRIMLLILPGSGRLRLLRPLSDSSAARCWSRRDLRPLLA
jgi:hypothetical protein